MTPSVTAEASARTPHLAAQLAPPLANPAAPSSPSRPAAAPVRVAPPRPPSAAALSGLPAPPMLSADSRPSAIECAANWPAPPPASQCTHGCRRQQPTRRPSAPRRLPRTLTPKAACGRPSQRIYIIITSLVILSVMNLLDTPYLRYANVFVNMPDITWRGAAPGAAPTRRQRSPLPHPSGRRGK